MTQPTVNQIIHEIKDLDDEKVKDWIARGLRVLDAEKLKFAIENDVEWSPFFMNHFHLGHPPVRMVAKYIIRIYWHEISSILTDVSEIYKILAQDPRRKQILDQPAARLWLNKNASQLYSTLYDYCWR